MAETTIGTYLGYKEITSSDAHRTDTGFTEYYKITSYDKLADIVDYPDMGSEPEQIETTTLSNLRKRSYVEGLQDSGSLSFTCNYDKSEFLVLRGLVGKRCQFCVLFDDGNNSSAWEFVGTVSAYPSGGGVNEVRQGSIVITADVPPELNSLATASSYDDTSDTIAITYPST